MKNLAYIVLLALLFTGCKVGCKTKSDYQKLDKGFKSEIKIEYRQPYCGGARPTPEMEKGTLHPFVSKKFVIKKMNEGKVEFSKSFSTDEFGNVTLGLSEGNYSIYFANKAVPFEEFKQAELKKIEGKQLKLKSDDCLKEYWEKADGKITVTSDAEYKVEIRRTCYADFNYCMQYTGPLRP